MDKGHRVAIVGVGLIGGSIGLALKERKLAAEVIGIGRRSTSLQKAADNGVVDWTTTNLISGVKGADLVVVATPVDTISDTVLAAAKAAPQATITDVGSTKSQICQEVRKLAAAATDVTGLGNRFLGSHPLAGDHRTGPEHARGDLFNRRTVVVTPEDDTPPGLVVRVHDFWSSLGASVELMSPEEHDRALGATSHLPHLIAAALAASTPEEWLRLAATGWGDTTRIAASEPGLWTQIFSQNRLAILDSLKRFEHQLETFRQAIESGDLVSLSQNLQKAKRIRDALGD